MIALDGARPVYSLILGIQNANLLKIADHPLDKDELDGVRASYIRDHLPDIKTSIKTSIKQVWRFRELIYDRHELWKPLQTRMRNLHDRSFYREGQGRYRAGG